MFQQGVGSLPCGRPCTLQSPLPEATAGILAAVWTKCAEPGTRDIQNLGSLGTQGHQAVIWAEQRFLGPNQAWALYPDGDPALRATAAILVATAWIELAEPEFTLGVQQHPSGEQHISNLCLGILSHSVVGK